jgi:glycosyltransferase involved in cell wall biosynthesis
MTIQAAGMTDIVLVDGDGLVVSDDGSIDVTLTAAQTAALNGKYRRRYQIRRNDTDVTILVGDISEEPR